MRLSGQRVLLNPWGSVESADVEVTLRCQRCNQPFAHQIHTTFSFSPVVSDEQAEALPETYGAVYVDEFGEMDLLAMIKDEIIFLCLSRWCMTLNIVKCLQRNRYLVSYLPRRKNLTFSVLAILKHQIKA